MRVPPRSGPVSVALARLLFVLVAATASSGLVGCGRPEFDGTSSYAYVEKQCSLGPRHPGGEGHAKMLRWLVDTLEPMADVVAVQSFTATMWETTDVELTNVIASFRTDARERVLLGAHWDTRAIAERDPDPEARGLPIPGANDGASGVAVLLELARTMAETPPRVGVDLVFFDGEDGGKGGGFPDFCLGSAYYARHMGDYCPSYAVVIDMIGDRDLDVPVEPNSRASSPEVVERVWRAAEKAGASSFSRLTGTPVYDDHVHLIRVGVPTALVIDFDYDYWHTHQDTPDKVSPESLQEIGLVLLELVYD
jgi:Zn-dependent M28 family amino/carboxypeptidase